MEYYQIIANRIASLCKKREYSIARLAAMSHLKQSTVSSIMNGASKDPQIQTLHKIANMFNMMVAEFLDFPALNEVSFDNDEPDELDDEAGPCRDAHWAPLHSLCTSGDHASEIDLHVYWRYRVPFLIECSAHTHPSPAPAKGRLLPPPAPFPPPRPAGRCQWPAAPGWTSAQR